MTTEKADPAKEKYIEEEIILPNGQRYTTKRPEAKLCIRMAISKIAYSTFEEKFNQLNKENPYVSLCSARSVVSNVNGWLKHKGCAIIFPTRFTGEGRPEKYLDLIPTSSPARKS